MEKALALIDGTAFKFNAASRSMFRNAAKDWFVNRPQPEMLRVISAVGVQNFAYTTRATGRYVPPFKVSIGV